MLDLIRTQGPIGQPEIARLTSLTPATVLSIIAELEEEGLVVEERSRAAAGERRAGRPARLYAFNASHGFVVGVDISTDEVEALLTNLAIQVLARATAAADGTREGILQAVLTTIREVMDQAGVEREQVLGIGLAMRGLADMETGEVVWHPQGALEGWPLVPLVSEATGLP
ncbi:MAG: ROK family protein, partial [Chloroflexi bacterium]